MSRIADKSSSPRRFGHPPVADLEEDLAGASDERASLVGVAGHRLEDPEKADDPGLGEREELEQITPKTRDYRPAK
jgi:hypothetical protein